MYRKIVSLLLALCLIALALPGVRASGAISGTCGDDAYWSFDEQTGTLTVSGTGAMWDYRTDAGYYDYHGEQEWKHLRSDIRKVVIGEGITSVGASAFDSLNNMTTVEFPDSLLAIDDFAFMCCEKLTDVVLPQNLQSLGQQCFWFCNSIQNIEIPASVTFIDADIFADCASLRRVVIHADPALPHFVIGNSPFRSCRSLTEIQVDEGHIMLVDFEGVLYSRDSSGYQLQQYPAGRPGNVYEIVDGTKRIEQFAMSVTPHLETVIVPAGVEFVGIHAFSSFNPNCVYGPEGIKNICFRGSAPEYIHADFTAVAHGLSVTCYYPYDEPSWTAVVDQITNSNITWTPYDAEILFTDVAVGSFYHEPVRWAVENGITTGASEITFNPGGECLRAQVVTFLWRAADCPEPTSSANPFVDVTEKDFFYKAVLWAVENGITTGADAAHFNPMGVCNRAQVVTFLWRAMGKPEPTTMEHSFTDVQDDAFYTKPVLWALENGITTGMTPDTFAPNGNCNRAQVVTFLWRTYAE